MLDNYEKNYPDGLTSGMFLLVQDYSIVLMVSYQEELSKLILRLV